MRVLLDEHISPALITRLAEVGVYAQSVPHVGLAGRADHEIWQYALDHDFAVVTTNARDSIELLTVDVLQPKIPAQDTIASLRCASGLPCQTQPFPLGMRKGKVLVGSLAMSQRSMDGKDKQVRQHR